MDRIGFFYADTVGNMAYGERFGNAAVLLCDNDTFEILYSILADFNNLIADLDRVAYLELREFGFHAFCVDSFNNSFHFQTLPPLFTKRS